MENTTKMLKNILTKEWQKPLHKCTKEQKDKIIFTLQVFELIQFFKFQIISFEEFKERLDNIKI